MKDRRSGFTMVEIIVVLVILAILAAASIPTLLGFVQEARRSEAIAECRRVTVAARQVLIENYAQGDGTLSIARDGDRILMLAEAEAGAFWDDFGGEADQLSHLYYRDTTGKYDITYCGLNGCGACGNTTAYTVAAAGEGSVSTAAQAQAKLNAASSALCASLKTLVDNGTITIKTIDSVSTDGASRNALWATLPVSVQTYLNQHTWKLENTAYGWRLFITEKYYDDITGTVSNVTVYKYDPTQGYQVATNGSVRDGKLTNAGTYNSGWVDTVY